jgi:hypothetical protein
MVAFGILGIWIFSRYPVPIRIPVALALLLVAGTGIYGLIADLRRGYTPMPDPVQPYRDALKSFRHRWMLTLWGAVALVDIAGQVGNFLMQRPYVLQLLQRGATAGRPPFPTFTIDGFVRIIPNMILGAWESIYPRIGVTTVRLEAVFVAVAIVAVLPWVKGRLGAISEREGMAAPVRFARAVLPFVLLCSAIIIVGELWHWFAACSKFATDPSFLRDYASSDSILGYIVEAVILLAPVAVLFGGLTGSLRRALGGESVNSDTFLADGLLSWKSTAGTFLVLFILLKLIPQLWLTPALSIRELTQYGPVYIFHPTIASVWYVVGLLLALFVRLGLLFAPYEAACAHLGTTAAVRAAFRKLLSRAESIARFAALGVTMVTVIHLAEISVMRYLPGLLQMSRFSLAEILFLIFGAVYLVFIALFISTALWFLYTRISATPDEGTGVSQ